MPTDHSLPTSPAGEEFFEIKRRTVDGLRNLVDDMRAGRKPDAAMASRLRELEKQLAEAKRAKGYGLVWEEEKHREHFEVEAERKLPVLVETPPMAAITNLGDPDHVVIEGDNIHALAALAYTHKRGVDLIYIDPPYNTGAKNWLYNNDYVDKDDEYRHSKWLSFMNNRLKVARGLLAEDGVLVCAIDENEQAHLSVLLEQLFPAYDQYTVTVVHNPKGVQGSNFSYTHEYAIFVVPKGKRLIGSRALSEDEVYVSNLRNWGSESERSDAKNCFYPIIVRSGEIVGFGEVAPDGFHPKGANERKKNGDVHVWPVDEKGVERKWRYARQSVEEIRSVLQVKESRGGSLQIMIAKGYAAYKTVWTDKKYDASEYGTKLLREIIPGCEFDFPKSLHAVYDCLFAVVGNRKDALVLDFFAGSGTTGHAVMEMNRNDGGRRRFILVSSRENTKTEPDKNLCRDVTWERVRRISQGYRNAKGDDVSGLGGNLRYFKTAFVPLARSSDDRRAAFMDKCDDLLRIRESCYAPVKAKRSVPGLSLYRGAGDRFLAVLYDPRRMADLRRACAALGGEVRTYVFTGAGEASALELSDLPGVRVETIPDEILAAYRKVFKF